MEVQSTNSTVVMPGPCHADFEVCWLKPDRGIPDVDSLVSAVRGGGFHTPGLETLGERIYELLVVVYEKNFQVLDILIGPLGGAVKVD